MDKTASPARAGNSARSPVSGKPRTTRTRKPDLIESLQIFQQALKNLAECGLEVLIQPEGTDLLVGLHGVTLNSGNLVLVVPELPEKGRDNEQLPVPDSV